MRKHTTTDVIASNIDPFKAFSTSARGNRAYWACTWLQSETPNGRYEIEMVTKRQWIVTHHQVLASGKDKIVRSVGKSDTKSGAVLLAQIDSIDLSDNVMTALLRQPTVGAMLDILSV